MRKSIEEKKVGKTDVVDTFVNSYDETVSNVKIKKTKKQKKVRSCNLSLEISDYIDEQTKDTGNISLFIENALRYYRDNANK